VIRGVAPLDVRERLLLVNVNEYVALDRFKNAGAFDFARLEDHVTVGKNHRLPPGAKLLQNVQRARVQAIGERIVHQVIGGGEEVPLVGVLHAKTLESAQVIPIAQFLEEFLLNRPEPVATLRAEFTLDMALEIILDAIVVQQRVVHVH
jgi:hypothetical protein